NERDETSLAASLRALCVRNIPRANFPGRNLEKKRKHSNQNLLVAAWLLQSGVDPTFRRTRSEASAKSSRSRNIRIRW
ncbi:MAG TPA: hypothetical protein DCP63_06465, partial [Bacteroidetes bacterium]|nr:hypothetical protein [Bacteroidota bacterium]